MEIPEAMLPVVGDAQKDTRNHLAEGGAPEYREWLDKVTHAFGQNLILLTWVPDYVGVSRMAVHKRMQQGYMTTISFKITKRVITLTGSKREPATELHSFAFIDECKAWVRELAGKARIRAERHRTSKTAMVIDLLKEGLEEFTDGFFAHDPRQEYEDNHL
jgi:hypothetical protein